MQFPFHPYLPYFPPNSQSSQGTSSNPAPCLKFGSTLIVTTRTFLPTHTAYEDGTEYSETSAHKIQTPWNYPKGRIQHSEQGGSLKLRTFKHLFYPPNWRATPFPLSASASSVYWQLLSVSAVRHLQWRNEEAVCCCESKQFHLITVTNGSRLLASSWNCLLLIWNYVACGCWCSYNPPRSKPNTR
jgi:hypothetical protein